MRTVVMRDQLAKAAAIAAWRLLPSDRDFTFEETLEATAPYYEQAFMEVDEFVAAFGRDMLRHVKTAEVLSPC